MWCWAFPEIDLPAKFLIFKVKTVLDIENESTRMADIS